MDRNYKDSVPSFLGSNPALDYERILQIEPNSALPARRDSLIDQYSNYSYQWSIFMKKELMFVGIEFWGLIS